MLTSIVESGRRKNRRGLGRRNWPDVDAYGTHTMRRTKASLVYRLDVGDYLHYE
jgi:hypothetical protein